MLKLRLPVQFEDGREMYGAVLAMINKTSPPLATMIHENVKYKPFSIELPDIVNALDLQTEAVFRDIPNVEVIREIDYRELLKTEPQKSAQFRFQDVLNRSHGINYPVADPAKLILSLKNRWNSLFPEKIQMVLPQAWERPDQMGGQFLKLVYADTSTRSLKIGDWPAYITLCGNVRIKAVGDDEYRRNFMTLARFAEYAGTGSKTTMGCGVTRLARERKRDVSVMRKVTEL